MFGTSCDRLTTCSKNDLIIKYLQIIFAEFNFLNRLLHQTVHFFRNQQNFVL